MNARKPTAKKILATGKMPRRSIALRKLASTALLALTTAAVAQTAPAMKPESAPVATAPATAPAALPPGHPVIGATTLPAATGALPAGHPPMDVAAATQAASAMGISAMKGTLNISILGASAGGASPANDPVTVDLYNAQNTLIKKLEYKADANGQVAVTDIPLMPPVSVVVSIHHAGLLQQAEAPQLSLDMPAQAVQMKVFDPTDEAPAWTVAMQHMIVEWLPDGTGARITEMVSVNNPGDRAWQGAKTVADGKEKRTTLTLALPPGADQVQLGGSFDEDLSRIEAGKLVTGSPMFPGRSEFQLMYMVPAHNGSLDLPIVAPAAVGNLIVFVPADDTQIKATGVSGGAVMDMGKSGMGGGGKVRMYQGQNLAAGDVATLSVSGIKPAEPELATEDGSHISAKNVVIGGAFLIVLVGAGLMLLKKPAAKAA